MWKHASTSRSNSSPLGRARSLLGAAAFAALALVTACKSEGAGAGGEYPSPDAGVNALIGALRPYDSKKVEAVLGEDILSSGDAIADERDIQTFLEAYDKKHRIDLQQGDTATLVVGEDDWPMPIPLVRDGASWRFDAESGREEIEARRVGRNELSTIQVCRAIVDAQQDYYDLQAQSGEPVYASKILSDRGQKNGLYWETKEGEPQSPLGELVADAVEQGYGSAKAKAAQQEGTPRPYHGYCYRLLTAQGSNAPGGARSYLQAGKMTGGFAIVAWPATYGTSGIMSFSVCQNGIVYQKDLGEDSKKVAESMSAFDPGEGWVVVP
jgi:hypothetical protein